MTVSQQHNNLIELILEQSKQHYDKNAFRFFINESLAPENLTYQQLVKKVIELAAYLQCFIHPGDRIVLILSPGEDYVISLLACFFAGAVTVPIYPPDINKLDLSLEIFRSVIDDSQARFILTSADIQSIYKNLVKPLKLYDELVWLNINDDFTVYSQKWIKPTLDANSLAILLYTSGSTGAPKGVMLTHQNLIHDAAIMSERCKITEKDIFAIWLPPYHVSGIFSGIILPLYAGSETILFTPQQFLEKPQRWLEIISNHRVTMSGAPTFAYNICATSIEVEKIKNLDLSCWRVAVIGGEPIYHTVIEKFIKQFGHLGFTGKTFFSMYGLTEATMISTGSQLGIEPQGLWISRDGLEHHQAKITHAPNDSSLYYVNSGQVLTSINLKIINPITCEECKEQEIGEIWLSGDSVARGYWNKPDATKYTFQAFTGKSEGPFLRTGDLGFLCKEALYVTGRLKEMIIIRGINYYPNDIEASVLQSHQILLQAICAAFAVTIDNEEKLIITLELKECVSLTMQEAIFENVSGNIARRHGIQLCGIVFLNKGCTPRTTTGKVQRNICKTKVASGEWKIFPAFLPQKILNIQKNNANIQSINKDILLSMPSEEAKLTLREIIQTKLNLLCGLTSSSNTLDKPIAGFGIDSVMMVKFITDLRSDGAIEIPVSCFFDGTTIVSLADIIWNQLIQNDKIYIDNRIDFNKESTLDKDIKFFPVSVSVSKSKQNSAILLTGATGFLGTYLLHDLLLYTTADIYCLVRADNKEQAKQRLIKSFNKCFKWQEHFNQRIYPIIGELDKPHLGIQSIEYAFLANHIDKIVHNGASVNFVAPYHSLKSTNVDSVIEIIKLALHTTLKSIHFVSTLGVFNSKDRAGYTELKESDRLSVPENIFGGYAQSKWVAEELLMQAKEHGVPISIYRPGLITGDSINGYMNTDDFLCRFLKGCIQLKKFPNLNIPIDMTPVNYVSAAITYLSQQEKFANQVYHLTCPKPIPLPTFVDWINDNGYEAKLLAYDDWLQLIVNISTDNTLYTLIPFLTEKQMIHKTTFLELFALANNPMFSQVNTQAALKDSHIKCAQIDDVLLRTYFNYFTEIHYLEKHKNRVEEMI